MSMTLEQAKEKLAKYGQEHVLKYYGELTEEEKRGILDQIEATDMSILEALSQGGPQNSSHPIVIS